MLKLHTGVPTDSPTDCLNLLTWVLCIDRDQTLFANDVMFLRKSEVIITFRIDSKTCIRSLSSPGLNTFCPSADPLTVAVNVPESTL